MKNRVNRVLVSMPSRAFLVSPSPIVADVAGQTAPVNGLNALAGILGFSIIVDVLAARKQHTLSQCPRGHSWFLHHVGDWLIEQDGLVSMPSRAFLVSPSMETVTKFSSALGVSMPSRAFLVSPFKRPRNYQLNGQVCLNALAGILGFSISG